mgnify:CR=1 FL=1|jgi:hypothetical protein
MLGPVLTSFLNNYQMSLPIRDFFPGQNSMDTFTFDYKNTKQPYIGEGWIDLYFLGEFIYQGQGCDLAPDEMDFLNNNQFSQLVVSESAASCILNQFARSNLGVIDLNEKRFNQILRIDGIPLTTESISPHLPLFEEKLGLNSSVSHDLRIVLGYKDINVLFG